MSSGRIANQVRKPFGSASSECTTWRGHGIRLALRRILEKADLWVTTRFKPRVLKVWPSHVAVADSVAPDT